MNRKTIKPGLKPLDFSRFLNPYFVRDKVFDLAPHFAYYGVTEPFLLPYA